MTAPARPTPKLATVTFPIIFIPVCIVRFIDSIPAYSGDFLRCGRFFVVFVLRGIMFHQYNNQIFLTTYVRGIIFSAIRSAVF